MLLSRLVDSEVLWMSIQFDFFLTNRQNGECYVRNFRWFLFRITPDPNIPIFKVRIFTSDIKFWIGVWVVDILTQTLLTLLIFVALLILWNVYIYIRHSAFFSSKCFNLIAILHSLQSTSLGETIKYASRWFIQGQGRQTFVNLNSFGCPQCLNLL